MGLLEVGGNQRGIAKRHLDTSVSHEPTHVIEAHPIPQPRGRCEMATGVRVQAPLRRKPRALAKAMQDLCEVATRYWPPPGVSEKRIGVTCTRAHC